MASKLIHTELPHDNEYQSPNDRYQVAFNAKYVAELMRTEASALKIAVNQKFQEECMVEWERRKRGIPEKQRTMRDAVEQAKPSSEWQKMTSDAISKEMGLTAVQEELHAIYRTMLMRCVRLADKVDYKPSGRLRVLVAVRPDSFHDKGIEADKYAKAYILSFIALLESMGFSASMKTIGYKEVNRKKEPYYSLEANCEPWMFDALQLRRSTKSFRMAYFLTDKLDPSVYYPELDSESAKALASLKEATTEMEKAVEDIKCQLELSK